jgi:hypothetical protein
MVQGTDVRIEIGQYLLEYRDGGLDGSRRRMG